MTVAASSGVLAGKRVLVTGAGVGIGRGISLACAQAGADVAMHHVDDLQERQAAEATVQDIRALGRRAVLIAGDFRDPAQVDQVARQAEQALGGIDILVNNAGITAMRGLLAIDPEWYEAVMAVNLRAVLFLTQAVVRHLVSQRRGGVIINLASLHAFFGRRDHALYAASKGAIVALTAQLAVELAPLGIRVNAVAPGSCVGENHQRVADPVSLAAQARALPAGRLSTPGDIGRLVVFLASPAADYFVGQTLRFDGGYSVCFPTIADYTQPVGPDWGDRYLACAPEARGAGEDTVLPQGL